MKAPAEIGVLLPKPWKTSSYQKLEEAWKASVPEPGGSTLTSDF